MTQDKDKKDKKVEKKIHQEVAKEVKKEVQKKMDQKGKQKGKGKSTNQEKAKQKAMNGKWNYAGGVRAKPSIVTKVSTVLSAWDKMLLAKHFPGEFNAPYVAGMNVLPIPTGVGATSFSLATATSTASIDGSRIDIGTDKYLVLMFAPSMSTYLGGGGTNNFPATARLSGFQALQANLDTETVLYQDGFDKASRGRSCVELYGSDFQAFAQAGFVWSAEMKMRLSAPLATIVGTAYEGAITMSQIPKTGLSIASLIKLSQKIHGGVEEYSLRGAVVNHNLAFDIDHNTVTSPTNTDIYQDLSLETVHFLVFASPTQNITSGVDRKFTLACSLKSNFAYWPTPTDPFAARIGQADTQADKYVAKNVHDGTAGEQFNWLDPLRTGVEWASMALPGFAGKVTGAAASWGIGKLKNYLSSNQSMGFSGGFPPSIPGLGHSRRGVLNRTHTKNPNPEPDPVRYLLKAQIQLDIERLTRFLNPEDVPYSYQAIFGQFADALDELTEYIKGKEDIFPDDTIPPVSSFRKGDLSISVDPINKRR